MPTKEAMQTLGEQILHDYETRTKAVAELRSSMMARLGQWDRDHQAMGAQLRAELGRSRAQIGAAVAAELAQFDRAHQGMATQLRADLGKATAALESDVGARLAHFTRTRSAMGTQLRAELGRSRAQIGTAVAAELAQFDRAHQNMAATRAAGQAAWRRLMGTMQAKRGLAVAEVAPPTPPPVAKAAPMAPPPPVIEKMAEEEAVARAEVAEITPELATLRDHVFVHLADHPDGTRLVEMEQEFGRPRILMARVVRSLMDEGKVEKRDLLYFAI